MLSGVTANHSGFSVSDGVAAVDVAVDIRESDTVP